VLTQLELRRKLIEFDQALKELDHAHVDLVAEKARTEELLINILPVSIADELKKSGKVQPKYEPSATILFADFKGFTLLAERMEPAALIGLLDQYFTAFDEIVTRHGLEKVKTIGDAYMAVAGVPTANRRHPIDACLTALEIHAVTARMSAAREDAVVGTGGACRNPYWASHVGRRRPAEVHLRYLGRCGEHGGAHGGELLSWKDQCFGDRGRACQDAIRTGASRAIETKHGRVLEMFFLNRLKAEYSRDTDGRMPSEKFVAECNRLLSGIPG
jgi:adenylate cyclase